VITLETRKDFVNKYAIKQIDLSGTYIHGYFLGWVILAVKSALSQVNPLLFATLRFTLASFLFVPTMIWFYVKNENPEKRFG